MPARSGYSYASRLPPVIEPASAMAEKAEMDSSLSIVRFFRNPDRLIIGYRVARLGTIVRSTTTDNRNRRVLEISCSSI